MTHNETLKLITDTITPHGPTLHNTIATAITGATARARGITNDTYAVTHSLLVRAELRTLLLDHGHHIPGWNVTGQGNLMAQTILRHETTGITLRFLKESHVTNNGVPHAGRNLLRRREWSGAVELDGLNLPPQPRTHLTCLLLWNMNDDNLTVRVVRTLTQEPTAASPP